MLSAATGARAGSLIDKLVSQIEASPAGCSQLPASNAGRQLLEADVLNFQHKVNIPAGTHFEVMDCEADGFVYRGHTIVLSARMSRLNAAQRFFIIAHEMGHVALEHHGDMRSFVARVVGDESDEQRALQRVQSRLTAISHQHELDADAFAVRTMLLAGYDPEQAAKLFDSIGGDRDNTTHPSARRRAEAIRHVAAEIKLKQQRGPGAAA
jgi:Zn-dependent protease with chaperone function